MDERAIDQNVVEELVDVIADGDPELFLELVGMFVSEGPPRASRIGAAVSQGDLATVEREVHALRGAAGNLGAHRVVTRAEVLQAAARAGNRPLIGPLADDLLQELSRALSELCSLADRYR